MKPRHWKAWALIELDGTLHSIKLTDPREWNSTKGLIELGWAVIEVNIEERKSNG